LGLLFTGGTSSGLSFLGGLGELIEGDDVLLLAVLLLELILATANLELSLLNLLELTSDTPLLVISDSITGLELVIGNGLVSQSLLVLLQGDVGVGNLRLLCRGGLSLSNSLSLVISSYLSSSDIAVLDLIAPVALAMSSLANIALGANTGATLAV
jgi:hypothetical protein